MPTTVQHPISPRFVDTPTGTLAVVTLGQGETDLVLWPSIFTDHSIHLGLAERLGDRFRLHLVDGPGHGSSRSAPMVATMADYAASMAAVLDALDLKAPIVGGTSWGGLVGAELALTQPDRVSGLVLMNTPMGIDGAQPVFANRMIAFGARWMLGLRLFRNGVARSFFEQPDADSGAMQHFHTMLAQADPAALSAHVANVILRGTPLRERLHQIAVPTAVIAGRDDTMYPVDQQAGAAVLLPMGRLYVVPGKHISAVDSPDLVAEAIGGLRFGQRIAA
ncbi:MAG: alpha/beta hydrolase [Paracoccaceae bacterium]